MLKKKGSWEIKDTLQGYFEKLEGHRSTTHVGKKRGGDILKVFTK